jgi:guanylate kinase
VDGKDYHFLTREEFERRAADGFFYEHVEFNDWLYGTSQEQWDTPFGLFIMTPSGIARIKPEDRPSALIIFLDVAEELREKRLAERGDTNDPPARRLESDRRTFAGFTDFDIRVTSWQ